MDINTILVEKQKYETLYLKQYQECERLKTILKKYNIPLDSDEHIIINIPKTANDTIEEPKEEPKEVTKEVTKEEAKQEFDPMIEYIETNENVWYLNIHGAQMRRWDNLYKHGVIHTWNKDYRYNSMYRKLNKGDIICLYLRGEGFISVCRVLGKPYPINEEQCKLIYNTLIETGVPTYYKLFIVIPVKYMAVVTKENAIKHKDIPILEDWSSGYRGSACIKPKNENWNKQVTEIYKMMKSYG